MGGRGEVFHDWYPYLEGFSYSFVKYIQNKFLKKSKKIIDPFSGVGTTAVALSSLGLECGYCEINPVLRKITDKKNTSFQPSGIAIHPITNHIYMIATAGKLLVVLSPEGEILGVEELDKDELKQPEGITFDQQGNMYISNEARGGKGNIMLFNYQKNE